MVLQSLFFLIRVCDDDVGSTQVQTEVFAIKDYFLLKMNLMEICVIIIDKGGPE